jgi:hypothetical protein
MGNNPSRESDSSYADTGSRRHSDAPPGSAAARFGLRSVRRQPSDGSDRGASPSRGGSPPPRGESSPRLLDKGSQSFNYSFSKSAASVSKSVRIQA